MTNKLVFYQQKKIYSKKWSEYGWKGEKIYPVLLPLEDILSGSTARLHTPLKPRKYNVSGTPRSGTMWMVKILFLLVQKDNKGLLNKFIPYLTRKGQTIGHFHEGIIEDFDSDQYVIFIHRDIRDCIVSGYFYLKNNLHEGTMGCNANVFSRISKEEGIEKQLVMYMKYRMPVYDYWFRRTESNVIKVKYENLLSGLDTEIKKIEYKLPIKLNEKELKTIIKMVKFKSMSGGRVRGEENQMSHQRKGIFGDWSNHFTKKHIQIFRLMGGEEFLQSVGYEVY
jgi:hypothetical protein